MWSLEVGMNPAEPWQVRDVRRVVEVVRHGSPRQQRVLRIILVPLALVMALLLIAMVAAAW
jgi:hypothetical protein